VDQEPLVENSENRIEGPLQDFRDLPPRPKGLSTWLALHNIPKVGHRFSARVARYLKGDRNVYLVPGFYCLYGNIVLGRGCSLGDSFCLDYAPIVLGDGARLSFRNMLITSTHDPTDFSRILARPIVIEENAWITSGCIILGGVRIGAGTIVAAGSVVTRSVPPGVMVAGNPARVVRRLHETRTISDDIS
jgi:maltose O-acetyltransferase